MSVEEFLGLKNKPEYLIKLDDREKKVIITCLEAYLVSPKHQRIAFIIHDFLSQLIPERYGLE